MNLSQRIAAYGTSEGVKKEDDQRSKKTGNKVAAATKYASTHAEALAHLDKIRSGLMQHKAAQARQPHNWGYVGDVTHYAKQLHDISDSLHGQGEYKKD